MKVSPTRLRKHLAAHSVPAVFMDGWDSARIDPYKGKSDFVGIVLHHTAGRDSLAYCMRGAYPPVRNCHFLIGRDGTVYVLSGTGAYHAGSGGPWRFTPTAVVPKDAGNSRLYGIEIESMGSSARIDSTRGGMTPAQVESVALLCAALLDAMRLGPLSFRVSRVIRHRDWTSRKVDTRQDLDWWRAVIRLARKAGRTKGRPKKLAQVKAAIGAFVRVHRDGRA